MTRHYTQSQVARIFAEAAASAEEKGASNWDAYMLGFVSARLGVDLSSYAPAVTR